MVSAFVLFALVQSPDSSRTIAENWLLNTTTSQKAGGDLGYTNRKGADTVTHKYTKLKGKEPLNMRLKHFSDVSESADVAKYHWTVNGTEAHLVIRSVDQRMVASYCGQSKSSTTIGTTYYPGSMSQAAKDDIIGFYKRH